MRSRAGTEMTRAATRRRVPAMFKRVTHTGVWVTDQDEALAFYRDVLGFEVRMDVTVAEYGNLRWLSVGLPGQDLVLQLTAFDPPQMDEATGEQVRQILAKGYTPPLIFEVDDCRATIARLRDAGVDITQEAVERDYGVDAGIR